jgi:hypothetical protein
MNGNLQTDRDLILAEMIVNACERQGVNLCGQFDEWTKTAMALADVGEAARPLFHRLAAMDERYKQAENERKFTECLRTARSVHFPSLVYLAKTRGVDVDGLRKETAARCGGTETPNYLPNPLPPRQYAGRLQSQRHEPRKPDFIDGRVIGILERRDNALAQYLRTMYPAEEVARVMRLYRVGGIDKGALTGAAVFPQLDEQGRCRTAKVIRYKADGHRDKEGAPPNWLHAMMQRHGLIKPPFELVQCLFGQHLLCERPNDIVGVVEAEKSAIVCALECPALVWVATGGKGNFTPERLQPLQGRNVKVFADADAREQWAEVAARIDFASVESVEWCEWADAGDKDDVADLLLATREPRRESGQQGEQPPKQEQPKEQEPYVMSQEIRGRISDIGGFYEMCKALRLVPEKPQGGDDVTKRDPTPNPM